jgi:hypothetical protein
MKKGTEKKRKINKKEWEIKSEKEKIKKQKPNT